MPDWMAPPSREEASDVILVTGGAGYIGAQLVRDLLDEGYTVRVLDSLLYGSQPIDEVGGHPRFQLQVGDLRRPSDVDSALHGVDAVVHLGGIVGDPACALDEEFTVQVNLDATELLIGKAKHAGIRRFLFASTCSVYGASDGELDERSELNPVSLYANTKIAGEKALLAAADGSFGPVILRFATVYGAAPRPRFDLVVNLLTAKAVTEGHITIHGGEQWRPFVHVADIAHTLSLVLRAPEDVVSGQIFNVGSTDENYRLSEVGTIISELVPRAEVVTNDHIHDRRNYYVNFDKLRDRLGFRPTHSVRSGAEELRDLLALGTIDDYRDPRYNNHRYLTEVAGDRRGLIAAGD